MTTPTPVALAVTVVARQRLAIGIGSEIGYFTAGHPYVPGSALRGALAAVWITEHGPPGRGNPHTDEFRALFDGDIRYGHLLPEGSYRVPLSVYRCKSPVSATCTETVVDQAFARGEPASRTGQPASEDRGHCPGCGRRLEQSRGDLEGAAGLTRITRIAIDPATGRAQDGDLFDHAAMPAGTRLAGLIHGHHPWLAPPRTVWLGGRRTVGGQAEFTTAAHQPADPVPPRPGEPLVVRLASPAVFVDLAGRPRLAPEPALDLAPGAELLPGPWTRAGTWSGWHAASRLPKPTELCAEAGSTYRISGSPDVLAELAARLPRDGVGLRRAEGFGEVVVATEAWRQPTAAPRTHDETEPLEELYENLLRLALDGQQDPAWRWLTGTLRGLQIDGHRGGGTVTAELLDELLTQPTAADLSGEQRRQLRATLVGLTPAMLRDLTTRVLATTDSERRRSAGRPSR